MVKVPKDKPKTGDIAFACPHSVCRKHAKPSFRVELSEGYHEGKPIMLTCPECSGLVVLHKQFPRHILTLSQWEALHENMTDRERETAESGQLTDAQILAILKRAAARENSGVPRRPRYRGRDF